MTAQQFFILYLSMLSPSFLIMIIDIVDRIRNKKNKSVRVSLGLMITCFLGTFVALFGFLTNILEYFFGQGAQLWFITMMLVCYMGLIILIILRRERIVYSTDSDEIYFVARFKKKRIKLSDINRINLSSEYLDIYIGKERLRLDNIFLIGAYEFESHIKNKLSNNSLK